MSQYVDHSETVDSKIPRSHLCLCLHLGHEHGTSRVCQTTGGSRVRTRVPQWRCYVLARVGSFFCLCHGFVRARYCPCKFIFRKRRMVINVALAFLADELGTSGLTRFVQEVDLPCRSTEKRAAE